jgi:hypothetical protein
MKTQMTDADAKNRVIVTITITLCVFMLLSLLGTFALEWAGKETGTIWGRIFDLINVLAGALVGYVAGSQVQKVKIGSELEKSIGPASDDDGDEGVDH